MGSLSRSLFSRLIPAHEGCCQRGINCYSLNHFVGLFQTNRHRLLYQYVLAGVARIHSEAMMELVSQRDSHGVDVLVLQQLGVR